MSKSITTIIRGGKIVEGLSVSQQDLLIQDEHISSVGKLSGIRADKEIDASGLLVLPGAVDTHVHFNDVFMNTISVHDYYQGTMAAAHGGVTSIVDFANQAPGESLIQTLKNKKEEAEGNSLVDWGMHPVITQPTPDTLDEIPLMVKEGSPTIKCYMTYREEGLMMEYDSLKSISERLKNAGGMLMVHAEDNDIIEKKIPGMIRSGHKDAIYHARSRPTEAENRAIKQCIQIARETGGRIFIVHLASDEGVNLVKNARDEGLDVFAETCTHYLIFTEKMLERNDGIKWICSPPLRTAKVQEALWQGLKKGFISMVTSDDAAFSWEAKLLGSERFDKCPNGIPGVETRINVLFSEGVMKGKISVPLFVELVSTAPARFFGLYPQKGSLLPGADADIVLFDPDKKWTMSQETLHMATDWTAYENLDITGKIMMVFSRGELIINEDRCLAKKGRGRFIHRKLNFKTI